MPRELPTHPHIDHLKKQAKDLLDAHRRGETQALERIVAALPSFAGRSVDEAARAAFALHDAQSTIAREYGFPSWNELRAEVERRSSPALPDAAIRALMGRPLPPAVTAAMSAAWGGRGQPADAASKELPRELPLVAFRDALLTPGAIAPIAVGRASSLAAIDAALATAPSLLAVFSQREAKNEEPSFDDLYPVGCVALVRERVATDAHTFIVVEGIRWARLEALDAAHARGFSVAHIGPFQLLESASDLADREALFGSLRERAHRLSATTPQPERLAALIDSIRVAQRLSDLVVANLPCTVAEKARYAAEPSVIQRLHMAIALCDVQLATAAK